MSTLELDPHAVISSGHKIPKAVGHFAIERRKTVYREAVLGHEYHGLPSDALILLKTAVHSVAEWLHDRRQHNQEMDSRFDDVGFDIVESDQQI